LAKDKKKFLQGKGWTSKLPYREDGSRNQRTRGVKLPSGERPEVEKEKIMGSKE